MCKVEMAPIRISSIVAMNANYYNVYSVIRVQLCTWTTNLQSTVQYLINSRAGVVLCKHNPYCVVHHNSHLCMLTQLVTGHGSLPTDLQSTIYNTGHRVAKPRHCSFTTAVTGNTWVSLRIYTTRPEQNNYSTKPFLWNCRVNFRLLVMDTSMYTQKPCSGGTIELNHIVYNYALYHGFCVSEVCRLVGATAEVYTVVIILDSHDTMAATV
jgi:hypothetical protein